jgi:hypothetical protein
VSAFEVSRPYRASLIVLDVTERLTTGVRDCS